jgi:hypothetical protein
MRIPFSDLARPKQAAKHLARLSTDLKLSSTQEALARALGYRDWYELSKSASTAASPRADNVSLEDAVAVILELSKALDLSDSDVQYVLSRSRPLGQPTRALEQQQTIRCAIWRRTVFGPPGRGKVGTIVKDKAFGDNTPCYLRRAGPSTHLLSDTGMALRADFEVVTPRTPLPDFVPSRLWLPYGYWTLRDDSEVVFSRDYFPLWRTSQGAVERLVPVLWIRGKALETHFIRAAGTVVWAEGPARELALQYLAARRIYELPNLVDVMPHLFESDVDKIEDGVRRLHENRQRQALPLYAKVNARVASA